jgi:hypothetical protein
MELEMQATINRISTTYRKESSPNGYRIDSLKSFLQKACRRGLVEDAWRCGVELYFFRFAERGKGYYTNLLHRIMITYLEDVSLGNYKVWMLVDEGINVLKNYGDDPESRVIFGWLIESLCVSKHTRYPSHAACAWKSQRWKLIRDHDLDEMRNEIHGDKATITPVPLEWLDSEDKSLKYNLEWFAYYLEGHSEKVLHYFFLALDYSGKINAKYTIGSHKSANVVGIIFRIMRGVIRDERLRRCLWIGEEWYWELKNLKESFLCLLVPLLFHVHGIPETEEIHLTADPRIHSVFDDVINGTTFIIPDYAIDMHTKEGRKKGSSRTDFAKKGAYVTNELDIGNPRFKAFYDAIKEEDDTQYGSRSRRAGPLSPLESDTFTFLVRAQITCSASRPDTYFGMDNRTNLLCFVKGPYLTEDQAKIPCTISEIKSRWFKEIHCHPPTILCLRPDLFPDVPLGTRTKVDRNKGYWFITSPSLIILPIPSKIVSSTLWINERVVDRDKAKGADIPSPLNENRDIQVQYVMNMVWRYIIGIPDPADRNFLIVQQNNHSVILSTDEETMGHETNYVNGLKAAKCKLIVNILRDEESLVRTFRKWLRRVRSYDEVFCDIVGKHYYDIIKRMEIASDLERLCTVFTPTD